MSKLKKTALVVFSFFIIAVAGFLTFAFWGRGASAKATLFEIKQGSPVTEIATNLQQAGIIKYPFIFKGILAISNRWRNLQAGVYELSGEMSPYQVADKIARGETKKVSLTIIEGWTMQDIAQALNEALVCRKDDFLKQAAEQASEGYLFPDTYQFSLKISCDKVISTMKDNFYDKISGISLNKQTIIMASLLEKEVRTYEDKQMVAGILWKRLGVGWRLQVDASPITYEKDGLPESPICNPGLDSIKAAMNYKESPYWYYLSAKDGTTIFSKTFDEHKIAKQKYL